MEHYIEKFSKEDYQVLTTLLKMTENGLHRAMFHFVQNFYKPENVVNTKHFIYCKGNIPVMLVAHMDTVFTTPPVDIYYDSKATVMWSPQGLGADDRAGVYAILKILQAGLLPYICLTTQEENGGIGASVFVKKFPNPPKDLKYIIEFDRQGINDCVFYWCHNKDFITYTENFGFEFDYGTFSDISEICPAWKIAGVNLSVGYLKEHTTTETLNTTILHNTINAAINMLKSVPKKKFDYILDQTYYMYGLGFPTDDDYSDYIPSIGKNITCQCHECKRFYPEEDVIPVLTKENHYHNYCIDCLPLNVTWCNLCGNPFEAEYENQIFCNRCKSKKGGKITLWGV